MHNQITMQYKFSSLIPFHSDNKSNDRYKSNLKSIKRHATTSSVASSSTSSISKSENNIMTMMTEKSSTNETKHHVNFNKRAQKNQYSPDSIVSSSFSYLRSATDSSSKYHHVPSQQQQQQQQHTSSYNHNSNIISSNNSPYANSVLTEAVEQPTLMELECIAGYDGGLPQYFFLEAYDSRTRKLRLNITSALNDVPLFRIDLAGMRRLL